MSKRPFSRVNRLSPTAKFALWMLVADILVGAILLVFLREPAPVLVTFVIVYLWTVVFFRRSRGETSRAWRG